MPKTLKRFEQSVLNGLPLPAYCRLVNFKNKALGRDYQIEPFREDGLHRVSHGGEQIVICRRPRHRRYKKGVTACAMRLADEYGLSAISVSNGGVFVDCGANVGELGYWARANNLDYYAFEPEPMEADCVDINFFGGDAKTVRKALWHKEETLTFYSAPDEADSSLFEAQSSEGASTVQAIPLDAAGVHWSDTGLNILKLEAEGAEPEILDGASSSLSRIHYIAVDCGYERGPEKRHTFIDVCDRLLPLGFRPIEAQLRRITVLFKNTNLV